MAITNKFGYQDLGKYGFQVNDQQFGGDQTAINPRTKERERVTANISLDQLDAGDPWGTAGGVQAQYKNAPEYGFLSENPDYKWGVYNGPEKRPEGLKGIGGFLSTPVPYLMMAGLAAGAAAGAGAGAAGAGGAEAAGAAGGAMDMGIGTQGWMDYLGSQAGGAATGGGMASGADIFGNYDFGGGVSGAEGFTGGGASPAAGGLEGVINQVKQIPGGGSVLSRIANGTATSEDWMSAGGKLLSTALGIYGSSQQSNALSDLASKYENFGGPSRARFESSMSPGFNPMSIPGYAGALDSTSKSVLARLSASGGNPFGNPGGLIDANKQIVAGTALPAINEYQRLNANTGFGNSMNGAMNLQQQAIGADGGALNALGYGLNSLTSTQPSLADLYRQITGGLKLNDGTGLT